MSATCWRSSAARRRAWLAAATAVDARFDERFARTSAFLTHPVFHRYRSETDFQRYVRSLEAKDLSLVHSMIALGSCTLKLNAAAEMFPVTWPEIANIHPFAPRNRRKGTGHCSIGSRRPLRDHRLPCGVAAAERRIAGRVHRPAVIRAYHHSAREGHRNICLIPQSAHGTNPASAVMAGMQVVVVKTDPDGNIDVADLKAKAASTRPTWRR